RRRNLVKKIAPEEPKLVKGGTAFFAIESGQLIESVLVKANHGFRLESGTLSISSTDEMSDVEEAIRHSFHRRNDHNHAGMAGGIFYEAGCVEHSFGTEERRAAEFEGERFPF